MSGQTLAGLKTRFSLAMPRTTALQAVFVAFINNYCNVRRAA